MLPPTTRLLNLLTEPTRSRPVYDTPPLIMSAPRGRLRALATSLASVARRGRRRS
jgi:hypothetical protein